MIRLAVSAITARSEQANATAWLAPIGRPKAWRSPAYATDCSRQHRITPTARAAMATRPSSRICEELGEAPAPFAQQVGCGHAAVGEAEPVGVGGVPAHLPVGRLHREPGRAGRHDDRRDLGHPRPGPARPGGHGDERGDVGARVGDERLLAVRAPTRRPRRRRPRPRAPRSCGCRRRRCPRRAR